ncbi:unnamed protein product [Phyllotreta striolata]|uniref:Coenzyme Q-binding protein COQ10 START domain-containing protein n=1 Tax=Phyllotreta striolata TaxID=444603 RepID=A0A9N9TPE4_PHYSR|nr:unnamed protein product [Phyllotreta striolata]
MTTKQLSQNDKLSVKSFLYNNVLSRIMVLTFLVKTPSYRAKKLVCFSRDEMYNIVSDVQNYESFLPFCTRSTITESTFDDGVSKQWSATLEIGFPPITENFTSTVVANRPHSVQAFCTDGKLFEYLETTWIFDKAPSGDAQTCVIDFSVRFKFRSVFYAHLASIFFNKLVQNMEKSFIEEARRRYGREAAPVFEMETHNDEDFKT